MCFLGSQLRKKQSKLALNKFGTIGWSKITKFCVFLTISTNYIFGQATFTKATGLKVTHASDGKDASGNNNSLRKVDPTTGKWISVGNQRRIKLNVGPIPKDATGLGKYEWKWTPKAPWGDNSGANPLEIVFKDAHWPGGADADSTFRGKKETYTLSVSVTQTIDGKPSTITWNGSYSVTLENGTLSAKPGPPPPKPGPPPPKPGPPPPTPINPGIPQQPSGRLDFGRITSRISIPPNSVGGNGGIAIGGSGSGSQRAGRLMLRAGSRLSIYQPHQRSYGSTASPSAPAPTTPAPGSPKPGGTPAKTPAPKPKQPGQSGNPANPKNPGPVP